MRSMTVTATNKERGMAVQEIAAVRRSNRKRQAAAICDELHQRDHILVTFDSRRGFTMALAMVERARLP